MRSVPVRLLHARSLVLLVASSALACASNVSTPETKVDPQDPLASTNDHLTALGTACTFNAATGAMVVTVADGETAILSKRAADSAILQNGQPCTTAVTASTLKKITVTGSSGAQTLILDFTNGVFATGTSSASASGIVVDLKGGGDEVGVRGTSAADSFVWGTNGSTSAKQLLVNNDAFVDASIKSYASQTFIVSMGDGDDTVSTAGSAAAGNAFGQDIALHGGNGNDTFAQGSNKSQETITGGAGTDTVSYATRTAVVTVTVGAGSSDDGESGESDDIASDVEVVTGGSNDDVLTAYSGGSTLNGGAGNDTLTGGAGADTINGGAGNDTIDAKAGNDTIDGGDDNDTISEGTASNGMDVIGGGAGVDVVDYSGRTVALVVTMDGKAADDGEANEKDNVKADVENILGGSAADNITGNDLANKITGNGGGDTMSGGNGDDVFDQLAAADGADIIHGGAGVDLVDYSLRTGDVTAALDNTATSGESGETDKIDVDVENLYGGDGDDTLTGNALNNEIIGGVGDDTLNGMAGDDVLEGGAVGNTEANVLDCGAGDGDIGMNEGGGTKTNCEF